MDTPVCRAMEPLSLPEGGSRRGGGSGAASNNWCFWQLISLNPLTNRDQVTGLPSRRIAED